MTYKLDFLEEALAEWNKLNPSIKQPLKKKLIKVLENPRIPKNKLSGHPNRYKIKLRSIGYRLVYEVIHKWCNAHKQIVSMKTLMFMGIFYVDNLWLGSCKIQLFGNQ